MSETVTAPVNPLTGELTTIRITRNSTEREDVQGRIVKPGLAITPRTYDTQLAGRPRFNLTHVPTGLGIRMHMCGQHVQDAADLAAATPLDWTDDNGTVIAAAVKATDLLDKLGEIPRCGDSYCTGDGPEPPSYGVRCNTCEWEWEDEYNEGPLTKEQADSMGSDHECEPEIRIQSPVTGKWHETWKVDEAEAQAAGDPADTNEGETANV